MMPHNTNPAPSTRVQIRNPLPIRTNGDYVLYWMTAARRARHNFALDHAIAAAEALKKPLIVFEALRCDYEWASDRHHRFVIEGMVANAAEFADSPIAYFPYVEPEKHAGRGLLKALAARAACVVGDDFPGFFLPRMIESAAYDLETRFETVDSNGLFPILSTPGAFVTAYHFRRFLQKELRPHLDIRPSSTAPRERRLEVSRGPSQAILDRWPAADLRRLLARDGLAKLPIDHSVEPVLLKGGSDAARSRLKSFLANGLSRYADERSDPDADAQSGLSPYLHFGHIGVHEILDALAAKEKWTPDKTTSQKSGKKEGYWTMSPATEAFLDELVTWRELGFAYSHHVKNYDEFKTLPPWAQATLNEHKKDRRPILYRLDELETAATHDEVWNAAQRQLVQEGIIHNYLRMLWGKKIIEWSPDPETALAWMIHLNNKYAVDGRDPNSYSGILWCLGRYDRPWAPERPIFGSIRWMSSDNTKKKLKLRDYLTRFGGGLPFGRPIE